MKVQYWPELIQTLFKREKMYISLGYVENIYDKYIYQCPVCLHTLTKNVKDYRECVCFGAQITWKDNIRYIDKKKLKAFPEYHKPTEMISEPINLKELREQHDS